MAFATLLLVLAITLAPPTQRYFAQRAQINAYKAEIEVANSALQSARDELARWNDPTFVAAQARERLHYVFPGERQYVLTGVAVKAAQKSAPAAPIANQIPVGLPWYSELVASITSMTSTNVAP
jgi:hypothetical protein